VITVAFDRLDLEPGGRILDVGCGSGRHTAAAFRLPQATVVGMDIVLADLTAARQRLQLQARLGQHGGGRWLLCAADGLQLPFPDASFDLVICSEVLEHVAAHERAVAELARVLKADGDLALSVPRSWPERICWALSAEYTSSKGGHIRIYRKRDLIALIQDAGFTVRGSHHAHSLHTPFWWLKCLIGVNREDAWPVRLYHRFLTWDIMRQPKLTRWLECLLNPVLGKSWVVYCRKG
jgi:ubiquinone/menaquinone biosynthesis C-methylase UbiE